MTITVIDHPEACTSGCRVLLLKGRNKDGVAEQRQVHKVSYSPKEFQHQLHFLIGLMHPNERIYASVAERDLKKGIREFERRQHLAAYDQRPEDFYMNLESRWLSCLMAPTSVTHKRWLFDADTPQEATSVLNALAVAKVPSYNYPTKNGRHIITSPFNRQLVSAEVLTKMDTNAFMLWVY